ncbi:cGMP-dependent protein kinase 1-like [Anthonomus grandis grandis]|uniref:cGMP-dependent protein kinase 1-like n=1 Tax=Anthonomus grandis grandis TaxID=2921223 RepID=UPI002165827B|nr:cGMP-dependent protein kinase 1-like [Anthonomus grandis grandis]
MKCLCRRSESYTVTLESAVKSHNKVQKNGNGTLHGSTSITDNGHQNPSTSVDSTGYETSRYKDTSKEVSEELKNTRKKEKAPEVPEDGKKVSKASLSVPIPEENVSRNPSQVSLTESESNLSQNDPNSRRRSGIQVSVPAGAEVTAEDELPIFEKSPEDQESIKKAIEANEFLSKILSGNRLKDIINAMQLRDVAAKKILVKQGEKGSEMFVSHEGRYKILVKGKVVDEFSNRRVFGELAILYNAKRMATIQSITAGKVWVLDRQAYQKIVIRGNLREQDEHLRFLQNVEYLNVVNEEVLRQVSNLLKQEFFTAGTVIIKQGDKGDKFYIIRAGTVTISKSGEGVLGQLGKGQCFGEKALQKEDTRQATVTAEAPGVECLTLTRRDFTNHFGDVDIPLIEVKKTSLKDEVKAEYQDVKLEELAIIKTLGVGGFGRVELVQHKKHKNKVFALKYLKKIDIVHLNHQEHVYNEKLIQMNCRSPFIVRLYRTYKDNKYVYFLMESCLGGDLFSLLHKQKTKRFEDKDAKFLSACVLEALEHLHSKGVVYRDLKPENLLVDKNGYLKLTDFGFAKKIPARGKTFTFAGTPEYVAPEIVLNRGHDRAVDYWAFGAFIFELLTGRTPFRTGDSSHMKTYNKILNGIDNVNFPNYVNPKAANLVMKLCKPIPADRLGMQKGGTKDIKAHKWYQGFDWQKFQQCGMPSPFKPKLKDVTDTSNFDLFKIDKDYPPDELSGWDEHF